MTSPTGPVPDPAAPPEAAAPPREPEQAPEPEPQPGEAVSTGHPAVDAALRELAFVAGAGPADQLPAFQATHRTLRETLASIDEAAQPG